ncbi:MAG: mobilization protein [Deltaproteobacteria bacterium]|jgi:hypothetical protein|nr:mobilization protein [Deltaproteobacteria bacterium]
MQEHKNKRTGGRPRADQDKIRKRTIGVRVNAAELNELRIKANSVGLSLAQLLRKIALSKAPLRPLVPEINRVAYAELAKLAGNLNQLVRAANEGRTILPMPIMEFQKIQATVNLLRLALIGVSRDCQND